MAVMEDYSKPAAIDFQWMSSERWIDGVEILSRWTQWCRDIAKLVIDESAWRRGVEHDNVHLLTGF
ncbi:MAG TPA: hypothetical protein VKB81_01315, partial [Nitrospira sp.]|nr:hypothetical protein [Nitrospira sp.]